MTQEFKNITQLNEFVESSKIRVASIMKQLNNIIRKHTIQVDAPDTTPYLYEPDFIAVGTLVNLLNAEIVLYCGNSKLVSASETQLNFIDDRYKLNSGENVYNLHVEDGLFQLDLNELYLENYSTYGDDYILDIKEKFTKVKSLLNI